MSGKSFHSLMEPAPLTRLLKNTINKHSERGYNEESVISYRQSLKQMDLLSLPALEKSLQFMERIKEQRKNRAEKSKFKNLFRNYIFCMGS